MLAARPAASTAFLATLPATTQPDETEPEIVNVPPDERLALRRTHRDYCAEWVTLLAGCRPDLTAGDAEILVDCLHFGIGETGTRAVTDY